MAGIASVVFAMLLGNSQLADSTQERVDRVQKTIKLTDKEKAEAIKFLAESREKMEHIKNTIIRRPLPK